MKEDIYSEEDPHYDEQCDLNPVRNGINHAHCAMALSFCAHACVYQSASAAAERGESSSFSHLSLDPHRSATYNCHSHIQIFYR